MHTIQDVFVTGFGDWRKLPRAKKRHMESQVHKDSHIAFCNCKMNHTINIKAQLIMYEKERREILVYFKALLDTIVLCAHQEIALRGNYETNHSLNQGNLIEILNLQAKSHDIIARN
jgi:hypothetical protein